MLNRVGLFGSDPRAKLNVCVTTCHSIFGSDPHAKLNVCVTTCLSIALLPL